MYFSHLFVIDTHDKCDKENEIKVEDKIRNCCFCDKQTSFALRYQTHIKRFCAESLLLFEKKTFLKIMVANLIVFILLMHENYLTYIYFY